jgi:hypothetical protein
MNWIEKLVIKNLAKKIIKKLPDLQEKGIEVINEYSEKIEKNAENLLEEIKIAIVKHIEKFETK